MISTLGYCERQCGCHQEWLLPATIQPRNILKIAFDLVYSLTAYACIERVLPQLVRKANGLHSLGYRMTAPFQHRAARVRYQGQLSCIMEVSYSYPAQLVPQHSNSLDAAYGYFFVPSERSYRNQLVSSARHNLPY